MIQLLEQNLLFLNCKDVATVLRSRLSLMVIQLMLYGSKMRSTGRFGIVGYSFAFILYQNHVRNCSLRCCACLESDDPRLGHSCGCDVFECDTQSCSGLYHSHRLSFIRPLSLSLFLFVRERCKELEPVAAGGGWGLEPYCPLSMIAFCVCY